MAFSVNRGVLFAGVLAIRDLLVGVYIRCHDFWETPI